MQTLPEKYQKLNKSLIIFSLSFLTVGILLLTFRKKIISFFQTLQEQKTQDQDPEEEKPDVNPIVQFYKVAKRILPDWDEVSIRMLVSQAMHETGLFKSKLYLEHNNAFGMMFPHVRTTTAHSPTNTGYSHYNSVEDSIRDMPLYFDSTGFELPLSALPDLHAYAKKLKDKAYFTDTILVYGRAMQSHFNSLKTILQ